MNLLSDPLNDRVVKEVPPPPHRPLNPKYIFTAPGSKCNFDYILLNFVVKIEW